MISVHAIRGGGGAAGYYLDGAGACEHEHPLPPAQELDGVYYANEHNVPGRWVGDGARALGLTCGLSGAGAEQFRELLNGRFDGEQLSTPVLRYTDGVARDIRVSAFDVTISAPKSVSVLQALATPEVSATVTRAHQVASEQALGLLQTLCARAARGHQGDGQIAPRIATDGLVAAAFDHSTSRALDPQLHTHVVVMNLIRGTDGRWSALDSRTLHRQATTASYLYQHLLRAELTRELGVAWGPVTKGVAEIEGIGNPVRREFSTRSRQIEAALEQTPIDKTKKNARTVAAKAACLITRPAKRHVDVASLRDGWVDRATAKGLSPDQLQELLTARHAPAPLDRTEVARVVLGPDGVTREKAVFDQGTVLRELIAALPPGIDLTREQLLAWTRQLLDHPDVVPVADGTVPTFTTIEMLTVEQQVLDLATRDDPTPYATVPSNVAIAATLRAKDLSGEQRTITDMLLILGRPVEVISGPAGSGKTRGLALATETWTRYGIEVRGTAVAALTAQGLETATGATSVSLTRLLNRPDQHLPEHGVLLVDEAGMIGTRQLHRLLTLAAQRQCKVVAVGDPAQLPELEAGGMFAALSRLPHARHLEGHGRQTNPWERQALEDLRVGQIDRTLDTYREHGRLHITTDRDELLTKVVADYRTARREQTDPWNVAVLATSRAEVTRLNEAIRADLRADGVLGRRKLTIDTQDGPRDYRKGDQVLVTKNDHPRELLNGTRATVRAIRRDGLVLQLTDGRRVTLDKPTLARGELDHGYAMTLHKAQGRTVHASLVVGDQSLSQEAGYVGLSRGTRANHLYLDAGSEAELRDCAAPQPRHAPALPSRRQGALSRSVRQGLAHDSHPLRERSREVEL